MKGLPQNWYEMKYYKGKFYTYISDINEVGRCQVNDSTLVNYFIDAPYQWEIASIKRIGLNHYRINKVGLSYIAPEINDSFEAVKYDTIPGSKDTSEVNIYIIDPKNKVAVFDFSNYFMVMISADKVRTYPAIVNYNLYERSARFEGDKIDFVKLLRSKGFDVK